MRRPIRLVLVLLAASLTACSGDDANGSNAAGGSGGDATTAAAGPTGTGTGAATGATTGGTGTGGAAAGCALGAPPIDEARTIQANGKDRTYILVVPDGYDPAAPMPLVFLWHGLGGRGAIARLYFGVEQAAAGQAILVYPDGLPVMGGAGWDLAEDGDDVKLFDAVLAAVSGEYCIDTARIYSAGHSFGAYMSNALGCARAGVLSAIAPVAGGGPYFECAGPLAAWVAHGSADQTVTIDQGIASRDHWLEAAGCSATTAPYDPAPCVEYAGCTAGNTVVWCQHDGGHDWPNFAGAGIWSFFASAP